MNMFIGTIARIILAIPFGVFGVLHLMNGQKMAGMVPTFIPGGVFWVYFLGVALIAGCLGLMTTVLGKWAALSLALLMLVFILTIHLPGMMKSMEAKQEMMMAMELGQILKNLGLCGGALTWFAIFLKQQN